MIPAIQDKGPVTGLDIDPTNNTMYGVGMYNGTWWLFTVNTVTGPPPRESNVGQVNRSLSGIAFNSQGNKLYATDGARLLTIDKSTGAVAEVGPFGADIGFVADIALVPGSFDRLRVRPPRIEYTPTFFALAELVREGMPWCPAGFPGCPGGRLSFHNRETDIPPHVLELGKDVQGTARARSDAKLFAKGLRGLQATVQRVPLGDHFDKEIKKQLADAIDSSMRKSSKTTSKEFLSTPILIKALNAVELDWRLPKIQKQTANTGQYIGIDRHYADDLVEAFVEKCAEVGIDIFRVFDAVNDERNFETAFKVIKRCGKHIQGTICYSLTETRMGGPIYNLDYYIQKAKVLVDMGADSLCIKDMAALIAPYDAYELIKELKKTVKIPIQIHTHYTSGMGTMTYLKAIEAGVDVVDTALAPFALRSSQPAVEPLLVALQGTPWDPKLDLAKLLKLGEYLESIAPKYRDFLDTTKMSVIDTAVLKHQIPGGMISNMVGHAERDPRPPAGSDYGFVTGCQPGERIARRRRAGR